MRLLVGSRVGVVGYKNIVRFVLYNVRNNKIRPFSVRTTKRNKERKLYYEKLG